MGDRFTGIGSVGPSYPVKPVSPPVRERPSGDRRKEPGQRPKDEDEGNEETDSERPKKGRIDEYI